MMSVFIFIFAICFQVVFSSEDVVYAAVIYRHGDRTPVSPYPNDPYRNESFWPVKFGELTNTGKMQHYLLGVWLRKRYAHLISEIYDPAEIYVHSTDCDRVLMSAQANLAGMYPPIGKEIWDKQLAWQPIPVHSKPEREDEVVAMKKPCKAYSEELTKYHNSKKYKAMLAKYKDLMTYVALHSGEKITTLDDLNYIYNILFIEELYNFTLPAWTQSVYPNALRKPATISFALSTSTPKLARLKAGPIVKEITKKMVRATKFNGTANGEKLTVYSAHDDNVASILNAMGLFDLHCPAYTATIFIELLKDPIANYTVRVSYRNSSEIIEPTILRIPFCGYTCPLDKFQKIYNFLITVNFDKECEQNGIHFNYYPIVMFVLLWLLIIFKQALWCSTIIKDQNVPAHLIHDDSKTILM